MLIRDRKNQDGFIFDRIDNFIREPIGQTPASVVRNLCPSIGVLKDTSNSLTDFDQKLGSKPRLTHFIIVNRIAEPDLFIKMVRNGLFCWG